MKALLLVALLVACKSPTTPSGAAQGPATAMPYLPYGGGYVPVQEIAPRLAGTGIVASSGKLAISTQDVTATDTGTIVDWAPTGYTTNTVVIRWNGSTTGTLTGITGGSNGRILTILNVSAGQSLVINCENTGSETTAANRLWTIGCQNLVLPSGSNAPSSATFRYGTTSNRWLEVGDSTTQRNAGQTFANNVNFSGGVVRIGGGNAVHLAANGSAVSLTNATCSSTNCTDLAGTVTTSSTTMTIAFALTYTGANDAICEVWPVGFTTVPTCTTSATAISCTTVVNASKYHYICVGGQ